MAPKGRGGGDDAGVSRGGEVRPARRLRGAAESGGRHRVGRRSVRDAVLEGRVPARVHIESSGGALSYGRSHCECAFMFYLHHTISYPSDGEESYFFIIPCIGDIS